MNNFKDPVNYNFLSETMTHQITINWICTYVKKKDILQDNFKENTLNTLIFFIVHFLISSKYVLKRMFIVNAKFNKYFFMNSSAQSASKYIRSFWCHSNDIRKWTYWPGLKFLARLFAFHIKLMYLRNIEIWLFFIQPWINSRANRAL